MTEAEHRKVMQMISACCDSEYREATMALVDRRIRNGEEVMGVHPYTIDEDESMKMIVTKGDEDPTPLFAAAAKKQAKKDIAVLIAVYHRCPSQCAQQMLLSAISLWAAKSLSVEEMQQLAKEGALK